MIKKVVIFIFIFSGFLWSNENIFFVGQNLNIISVISDRPELPNRIPADVKIVKKNSNIFKFNNTIDEILNNLEGFYIEPIKGIDRLYFRGIKNSLLFLYDGVPLTSDTTKNLLPADYSMNKNLLSKIEIVKGASSVFWGPDAFGGVVNLVPDELEANKKEIIVSSGNKISSITGKKSLYFKNFYGTFGLSFLHDKNDYSSNYLETYGKVYLFNDLNFTFHLSDYKTKYKTKYTSNYSWKSSYKYPFNLIKGEYLHKFKHSSFKFKAYFLDLKSRYEEDYFHWKQHSKTYFAEFRISRDFFNNNGLLTTGISYKKTKTLNSDVVVRGFIPDYIVNKDSFFTPISDVASFQSYLKSFYAQYVHNLKNLELWTGFRYDDHSKYDNVLNWNFGLGGFFNHYYFKLNYATAFRTPIADKFLTTNNIKPEKIRMLSFSNNFNFNKFKFSFTGFIEKIYHRIFEDNYGGFSEQGKNKISGLEVTFNYKIKNFKIWSNFTTIKKTGDREIYKILKYILIIPGKEPEFFYDYKERDLDYGAKLFGIFGFNYNFKNFNFNIKTHWLKRRKYKYLYDYSEYNKNFVYSVDLGFSYKLNKKLELLLNAKNILTNERNFPGKYYNENLEGMNFRIFLKYSF